MNIEYEKKILKDLIQVQDKAVKAEFENLLIILKEAKDLSQISNLKKLRSHTFAFRVRIGDFRVGFYYKDSKIIFRRIVHRKDFYGFFPFLYI
jgi:mRNA interferase RelE/StbE